jgi:pimeloyl-ACP methyl ester carboxylesterase
VQRIGRLRYNDVPPSGAGRGAGTLLLIHGFPLNPDMWQPQLEMAARGWRVIVPELRGFDPDPTPATIRRRCRSTTTGDTIDLLDKPISKTRSSVPVDGGYIAFAIYRHAATYSRHRAGRHQSQGYGSRRRTQSDAATGPRQGPSAIADALVPKLLCDATRASNPAVVENLGANHEQSVEARCFRRPVPTRRRCCRSSASRRSLSPATRTRLRSPLSEQMHRDIPGSELVVVRERAHVKHGTAGGLQRRAWAVSRGA